MWIFSEKKFCEFKIKTSVLGDMIINQITDRFKPGVSFIPLMPISIPGMKEGSEGRIRTGINAAIGFNEAAGFFEFLYGNVGKILCYLLVGNKTDPVSGCGFPSNFPPFAKPTGAIPN